MHTAPRAAAGAGSQNNYPCLSCHTLLPAMLNRACVLAQEAEVRQGILWEGMAVVRPWFDMPPEVAAMQPEVLEEDAVRTADGMDTDQKEVLTVHALPRATAPVLAPGLCVQLSASVSCISPRSCKPLWRSQSSCTIGRARAVA